MPDISAFFIACPLVFLSGFVDAIGGGGGLISLPAYMLAGLPPTMAVATNKLSSTLGTSASAFKYARRGCVNWRLVVPGIISAISGALMGARAGLLLSENAVRLIMLAVLPLLGVYVILRPELKPSNKPALPMAQAVWRVVASSFAVGMYDGIYGPGAGVIYILAYTALVRLEPLTASGNTKLVNLASNIGALAIYLANGRCQIRLGLAAALFAIAGHYLGASLAIKNHGRIIRPSIIIVLCVLTVKLVYDLCA